VTMDITMPDMGGMECSKRLLSTYPQAKIVILSSLKHDSLIVQGKSLGIAAFLQKPVKEQELRRTLQAVCAEDKEEKNWQEQFNQNFFSCLPIVFPNITNLKCQIGEAEKQGEKIILHGLAVIVGLAGEKQGRMIVNTSLSAAEKLTEKIFKKEPQEEEVLNCLSELANIICGHIISKFNNDMHGTEFTITPPSVILGENMNIINRKFNSFSVAIDTELGRFNIFIGLVGGI